MKKSIILSAFAIIALSLLLTSLSNASEKRGITENTIKVGLIADTTGPAANLGKFLLMGCEDYFRYLNEKGGIHGRKIELVHEDDQYQVPKAMAAFEKLVFKDEVLGILHVGGTPQTMALLPKIEKNKVPVIPGGQADPMYEPHKRYVFVAGSNYPAQAINVIDYMIHDLKAQDPKVGIVYMENEVGKIGLKACKKRLNESGLEAVSELELSLKSVDASSQVMNLKKSGANYVVLFELPPSVINFLKTAEKFDYYPTYLSYTWCADDVILKATGKAAKNGYYAASNFGAWHDDSPGGKELREIAAKYGHSSPKLPTLYIQGYTWSYLFTEGLRRAGRNITVEKFVDSMETLVDFDCGGLLSPMTYTPKSHSPSEYNKIFRADVNKGTFLSVTGWRKPRSLK